MADEHLQHLMQLIEAKQVYTSYTLLKKIPADTYIPGKQKILDELKSALIKGKAIHAILQNNRNNGDYPAALQQALKLQKIVPDYPNLKHDIGAIKATLRDLETTVNQAKIAATHARKDEVITLLQTVRQIDVNHPDIAIIEKTVRRKAHGKSAKSIIISILIIVIPAVLFGLEKIMVWRAEENLQSATTLITASKFKEANKSLYRMENNLRLVYVFHRIQKDSLSQRAKALQSSITFVQGMRGRVIHDGEFISEKKKNIITSLEQLLMNASRSTEKEEWQEALEIYTEALEFSRLHETELGGEQQVILDKIAELNQQQRTASQQQSTDECLTIIAQANDAFQQQNWQQVIDQYNRAASFAENADITEDCIDAQSRANYNSSVITVFLDKGDSLKQESQPAEAVDYYLQAHAFATSQKMSPEIIQDIQVHIDSLKEQVFMGRVRRLVLEGDHFIKQGDFDSGLSKYNFALTMLESNSERIHDKDKLTNRLVDKINKTEHAATVKSHRAHLENVAKNDIRTYFDLRPQDKLGDITISLVEEKDGVFIYRIAAKSIRDKMQYELLYQANDNTGKWKMVK
jgi:tetratricopeptide (TPR) repeat protein